MLKCHIPFPARFSLKNFCSSSNSGREAFKTKQNLGWGIIGQYCKQEIYWLDQTISRATAHLDRSLLTFSLQTRARLWVLARSRPRIQANREKWIVGCSWIRTVSQCRGRRADWHISVVLRDKMIATSSLGSSWFCIACQQSWLCDGEGWWALTWFSPFSLKMHGSSSVLHTLFSKVVLPALALPMTRIRKWVYFSWSFTTSISLIVVRWGSFGMSERELNVVIEYDFATSWFEMRCVCAQARAV